MKTKLFSLISKYFSVLVIFLLPLMVLPVFTDPYDMGKQVFLLASVFILFVVWVVSSLINKKMVFPNNQYFGPMFLFFAIVLISSLVNPINKVQSIIAINGPLTVLLMFLFLLLAGNMAKNKLSFYALVASGAVLSLTNLVLFLGKFNFPLTFSLFNLSIVKAWSPTGNILSHIIILMAIIPVGFALVYEAVKENKLPTAVILSIGNILILSSIGISLYLISSTDKPVLLPQSTAWAVAAESIKDGKIALWGVGPGRFLEAFTAFKPLTFNSSDFWSLRFNASSNWYFQLLTEVGIVGLFIYLNLVWKILKNALFALRKTKIAGVNLGVYLSLVILIIAQLFVPLNIIMIIFFFLMIGLTENREQTEIDIAPLGKLSMIFLVFPICFWLAIFFFGGKIIIANNLFVKSILAAGKNDGIKTYNLQIKALNYDGINVSYRIAYSQTNLALANSLAAKKDLTDQDRSTISQLIQQAIREAKSAVTIDPGNISAWENLANIYRNLINFAQGADQWAVAAYQEAIKRDPLNPQLRLELGGIYYSQQNFDQAINFFLQATNLKADWALAHYNLANALRERGAFIDAKREYEITQSLVKIDSADYQKVTSELEEIKKKIPAAAENPAPPAQPETLKVPERVKEVIKPPLQLPEEGQPPITPSPELPLAEPTVPGQP